MWIVIKKYFFPLLFSIMLILSFSFSSHGELKSGKRTSLNKLKIKQSSVNFLEILPCDEENDWNPCIELAALKGTQISIFIENQKKPCKTKIGENISINAKGSLINGSKLADAICFKNWAKAFTIGLITNKEHRFSTLKNNDGIKLFNEVSMVIAKKDQFCSFYEKAFKFDDKYFIAIKIGECDTDNLITSFYELEGDLKSFLQ